MKQTRYRWIRTATGEHLRNVGIAADGSLINPNNYPADLVRREIEAAEHRRKIRRQEGAAKAVVTRQRRHKRLVYSAARRIIQGHRFGPSITCSLCGRALSDSESIERGIGSECWTGVLSIIERLRITTGSVPS